MSDTPGAGPQNRVYVGAKPIISNYTADKLNAVWDKYYPEYHIDGQDVTYAADYQNPESVYYEAYYIYDKDNPSDATSQYSDYLLPSQVLPIYYAGGYWNAPGGPEGPAYNVSRKDPPGAAERKVWEQAAYSIAKYRDWYNKNLPPRPNSNSTTETNTSPTSNSANNSNKSSRETSTRFKPSSTSSSPNNVSTSSNGNISPETLSRDKSDLNKILGTVTSLSNPQLAITPASLPGRTSWDFIEGPVGKYNSAKCEAAQVGGKYPYGCKEYTEFWDSINNPNPFIKFDVSWKAGRYVGSVNDSGRQLVEHDVKYVRFKDLAKCGADPIQVRDEIDSKANFYEINKSNYKKAYEQIKAAGYNLTYGGPQIEKTKAIYLNNGISPLSFVDAGYWTGLPPTDAPTTGIPGYGEGRVARPYPY